MPKTTWGGDLSILAILGGVFSDLPLFTLVAWYVTKVVHEYYECYECYEYCECCFEDY